MSLMALRLFIFAACLLLIASRVVESDDEENVLLVGVNAYRTSFRLATLIKDENAECLADKVADLFSEQVCTNNTGSNAALGAVNQFSNYPLFLRQCLLTISNPGDGIILPVCVPGLLPDVVLSNFTKSQYSRFLNDTLFVGVGIAADDNWIVMVLVANATSLPPPADHDDDEELLAGINAYRTSSKLTLLAKDDKAECLADKIADRYNDQVCTNSTGSNAAIGLENKFSNYPQFLSECGLTTSADGIILLACVPKLRSDLVISNFTQSQYSRYVNDSRYVGAGIATEDDWIVMVLTTNATSSSPIPDSSPSSPTPYTTPSSPSDDVDDQLLAGVNTYRTSLNLNTLTKNENAECLADEIADQFKDTVCTNTTGSNTVPGTETNFQNYPQLLAKCDLNISSTRDGIVMPACIPGLQPDLVISNFTRSQYSGYLNNSQYVGAGIATENDWVVMVLTTSTPSGDFAKDTSSSRSLSIVYKSPLIIAAVILLFFIC